MYKPVNVLAVLYWKYLSDLLLLTKKSVMCTTRPIPYPSYQGSIGLPTLRRRTLCQKEEKGEGYFEGHGHIPIWPLKQRRRRKQDHCNLCVHIVCGPRALLPWFSLLSHTTI